MPHRASQRLLRELAEWRPEAGVISVYLDIDPADRGEGWRITLRERLSDAVRGADGRERRAAVEAAAARVLERFPQDSPHPEGRVQIGFVEVGGPRREVWRGVQMPLDGDADVTFGPSPRLIPLARMLEAGAPVGVLVVASEAVRVLEWAMGRIEELDTYEIEMFSRDWRERKSPRRDPAAAGTGTTAAGRDQFGQRLEHNRERFLKEAGEMIASRHGEREWRELLVFGESDYPDALIRGLGGHRDRAREAHGDLIRASATEVRGRVAEALAERRRERERDLVRQVEDAVGGEPGAALGPEEVLGALEQGRARHVVFDAGRDFGALDGTPVGELLIANAVRTSAEVTPLSGEAAEALARRDGAAALLRY